MPASTDLVSLDQAKDWAKRLLKATPTLSNLSAAQEAVGVMLGHASWHALLAFYKHKESSPAAGAQASGTIWDAPGAPDMSPVSGKKRASSNVDRLSFDEMMTATLGRINAKYPGLKATRVEVIANETDDYNLNARDVFERMKALEEEGHFDDDAMEMALSECAVRVHAPPDHVMVRVETEKGESVMTVLSAKEYSGA